MEIVILVLLGILIVGAVAAPLVRGARGHHEDAREFAVGPSAAPPAPGASRAAAEPTVAEATKAGVAGGLAGAADVEAEIARYRTAVQAGTLCHRCGEANPADAKFCRECGKALPASAAQEFAK